MNNMLTKHNVNFTTGMPAAFNELMKNFFGNNFPEWNRPWQSMTSNSGLTVKVHDHEVCVKLPFPGCTSKDFQIEVVGDFLTIKAEHSAEKKDQTGKNYICRERSMQSVQESVRLPVAVKGGETRAKYEDGVLTLHIPRLTENGKSGTKMIQVD